MPATCSRAIYRPDITFVSMDVSFISATLVLPAVVGAVGRTACARR